MGASAGGEGKCLMEGTGKEGGKEGRKGGIEGAWEAGVGDEGYMECGGGGLSVEGEGCLWGGDGSTGGGR